MRDAVLAMNDDQQFILKAMLIAQQITQYLDVHLPYRLGILVAHPRAVRNKLTSDQAVLNACFVASLVTARVLLNVIGIGKDKNGLCRFNAKRTDVSVNHLGGRLLDPASLRTAEQDLLLNFLKMADQSAAHFTTPAPHDWTVTHKIIARVEELVRIHVYDAAGRLMPRY